MSSLSNLGNGASKAVIGQPSYEVVDSDSHLDAPLTTAINVISAAGSADRADADRSSSAFTSAELLSPAEDLAEEELPELELIPETHLLVRLPSLLQSVAYQARLDRAYSIYEKIPQAQIPQEIRGLAKTLENLVTIQRFLIARDQLVVWQAVAHRSRLYDDIPNFAELNSLDDYLAKAAEFGDWLDQKPQARGITKLRVEDTQLSSIPPEVSKLTQLQLLDLRLNQIQKIEGLEPLTQLQQLFLDHNQIQKVEGLEALTQLQDLWLNSNQIQKLEGLETLTQLQKLYLDYNEIRKLEGLENLAQLRELWIGSNQIQKLEGLETLTQLNELELTFNQIQRIEGVEHVRESALHLEGNPINS